MILINPMFIPLAKTGARHRQAEVHHLSGLLVWWDSLTDGTLMSFVLFQLLVVFLQWDNWWPSRAAGLYYIVILLISSDNQQDSLSWLVQMSPLAKFEYSSKVTSNSLSTLHSSKLGYPSSDINTNTMYIIPDNWLIHDYCILYLKYWLILDQSKWIHKYHC